MKIKQGLSENRRGAGRARKNKISDPFPCNECVFIVQRKYSKHKMKISDSLDKLLIYEGTEVIKKEPIRKVTAGCRHCKGYYSYQMSFLK